MRQEMKVPPLYTPRYYGQTYSVSNPVEKVAIWNAEKEQELENLENNLDRLSRTERAIIQKIIGR